MRQRRGALAVVAGCVGFFWLVGCGGGGAGDTGGNGGGSAPEAVAVAVSPVTATLQAGAQQQFTASVSGTSNTAVNWSATGGTISTAGLYTAPSTAGTYTVTATSQVDGSQAGTATVTVQGQSAARWPVQFGTSDSDYGRGIALDASGDVYVVGHTGGSLGAANSGQNDAFLVKYDGVGEQVWSRQFGTSGSDWCCGVAVASSGGVFVTGYTEGSLGGANAGSVDAFLARYDSAGNQVWVRQLGTSGRDEGRGVAVDGSGNVYVTGATDGSLGGTSAGDYDAFLARYDTAGNQLWVKQFGTSAGDGAYGVAVDGSGDIYVAGHTWGSLNGANAGGDDAFLARYDAAGSRLWVRQFGTSQMDYARSVAVGGIGNVYVAGATGGDLAGLSGGSYDAFVARFDSAGDQRWVKQIGSAAGDGAYGVAVAGAGDLCIVGHTEGSLGGVSAGLWDAFLARYDSAGNQVWLRQFGTGGNDDGSGVVLDASGNAYVAGDTAGDLGGPNAGVLDAYLARYTSAGNAG